MEVECTSVLWIDTFLMVTLMSNNWALLWAPDSQAFKDMLEQWLQMLQTMADDAQIFGFIKATTRELEIKLPRAANASRILSLIC